MKYSANSVDSLSPLRTFDPKGILTRMSQSENKVLLRKAMRAVLSNLDQRWVKAASGRVCENLSRHVNGMRGVDHILAWSSFFAGEADLSGFIAAQLAGGRRVYLPQTRPDRSMQYISVNEAWLDEAVTGVGGVPEPSEQSGQIFDPLNAPNTLVMVPGLAFDLKGGRLGRGLGFYDHFLARSSMHSVRVVGVGWELQIVPEVPMTAHDQFVEQLITEERVVDFLDANSLSS